MNKCLSLLFFVLMIIPLSSFAPAPEDINHELNWFGCAKCNTLFYGARENQGTCPAGGVHQRGETEYKLNMDNCGDCSNDDVNCVSRFYFCKNCSCMFAKEKESDVSVCAAGGSHVTESWNFKYYICTSLPDKNAFKTDPGDYYGVYRTCKLCRCLVYGNNNVPCAGSGTHKCYDTKFVILFNVK